MEVFETDDSGMWKVLCKYTDAEGAGEAMRFLRWCPKTGFEGRKLVVDALVANKNRIKAEDSNLGCEEMESIRKDANEKAEKAFIYAGCFGEDCPMAVRKEARRYGPAYIFCGFDPNSRSGD